MKQRLRVLALVVLIIFCIAAVASAHHTKGYSFRYYSDPQYQNQVGEYTKECDGTVFTWGVYAGYQIYEEWPCPHQ